MRLAVADSLDAVVAAPGSHRVVLENETTWVLEVTIAPGEREPSTPTVQAARRDEGSQRPGAADRGAWPIAAPLERVAKLLRVDLGVVTDAAERVAP
jgi:hypothetical protein